MTKQSIVILHGWGSNPKRWIGIHDSLNSLKEHVGDSIHIPLLPGFDGEEPKRDLNVDDYVDWLQTYLKNEGLTNIVLVGHSNGGRIAIRYAAFHKDVKKLVLIAAAGVPNTHNSLKRGVFLLLAKLGKFVLNPLRNTRFYRLAENILYKAARETDYYKASPIMKKTMLNLLSYDASQDLSKINCETLCIWGRNDAATPLWMGERIVAGLKRGKLQVVDGGHNIHTTHPKLVAKYINEFI